MNYSLALYFRYFVLLLIIVLLYYFIGYPVLLEYSSIGFGDASDFPHGSIPGDYQKYYFIAVSISEQPIDIRSALDHLSNPNFVAPLFLAIILRIAPDCDGLLCYNLLVSLPLSAFIATQLHTVARRFNIGERKTFLLVFVVLLSPFSLLALTQVSKDLFSHLFYAVSLRAIFAIYDRNLNYSVALSIVFVSIVLVFVRPFQLPLAIFAWLILAAPLAIRDRRGGDVIPPALLVFSFSIIVLLHGQFVATLSDIDFDISDALPISSETTAVPAVEPSNSRETFEDRSSLNGHLISEPVSKRWIWDYLLANINGFREYYISVNPDSPMLAWKGYVFESFADLIYYIPKSFSMIIFEPNLFRLLGSEPGHTPVHLKYFYAPWALFISFAAIVVLCRLKTSFSLDKILLQIYIFSTLMPYPYFIPNYGNVARYSSFLVIFLLMILMFSKSSAKVK